MALETGDPIVPIAMIGTFEAQRGRKFFPRRRPRMRIVVGEALDPRAIAEASGARLEGERLRAVTDAVVDAIAALSGQERADEYVTEAKRRLAEQAAREAEAGGASGRTARRPRRRPHRG